MPDLELGPDDYRKQDPKTGRWNVPDNPKVGRLAFFAALVILTVLHFNRDAMSSDSLFWLVLIFAGSGGGAFYMWLKDVY